MSGEVRTVMRRIAKLLDFEAATVPSGVLKNLLVSGCRRGADGLLETAAWHRSLFNPSARKR